MASLYLNLPTLKELEKLLIETFNQSSSITDADIIITEGELDFITGKLIILIGSRPTGGHNVFIKKELSSETIFHAIRASIDTYSLTATPVSINPSYHVLKDSDPTVSYLVKKLTNMINSAVECILEIDRCGSILFHNKKFAILYDQEDISIDGNIYSIFDDNTVNSLRSLMANFDKDNTTAEFSGKMHNRAGQDINIAGHISTLPGNMDHYEIIFEDVTEKLRSAQKTKKNAEQVIISGFARHISHNVMNALTAAGGFLRQIKAQTEDNLHTRNLWLIINDKLLLIEEVVSAYNDFTHSLNIKKSEQVDLSLFFETLATSISMKQVERNFTAYLYKFTDNYSINTDFAHSAQFVISANSKLLQLAFCYILKDTIRYFSNFLPIEYNVAIDTTDDKFTLSITANNIEISAHIVETMLKPWDHQMLSQSFDYWGVMIASTIVENHNGKLNIMRDNTHLRIDMVFYNSILPFSTIVFFT